MSLERYHQVNYIDGTTSTDITNHVISIDKLTDTGTGEIASAQLFLNTMFGQFITESNSNTTPIIDQYNTIQIRVWDNDTLEFSRYMFVDDILPQQIQEGQEMQVELYGREYYLKKMKIPGHFYFIRYIDLIKEIIAFYNANRGSDQPGIITEYNGVDYLEVPSYPAGIFDFGSGVNCYDALMQIISRLSLPVSAGGAGDFYELLFEDVGTTYLLCKIFPLGSKPDNPVIVYGKDKDTQSVTETKQPIAANLVVCQGQQDTGRYPKEVAQYTARLEEYNNFPEYDSTIAYPPNAYVRYQGSLYQVINGTSPGDLPTGSLFKVITYRDYIGDIQYSPWTQDKAILYRNTASNPSNNLNTDFDSPAFPDSNLVVKDGSNYRNWVDFRVRRLADIPAEYLYDAPGNIDREDRIPEDTRLLIDSSLGTIEAPFTGSDDFGKPYADALVQYRNGKFIVIHNPAHNDEVAVNSEGIVYVYDNIFTTPNPKERLEDTYDQSTLAWYSMERQWLGLDCYHYPSSIKNSPGLVMPIQKGTNTYYNTDSAVEVEYRFSVNAQEDTLLQAIIDLINLRFLFNATIITDFTETVLGFFATRAAYNYGWWFTLFEAPFPKSTYNGISEDVGELFGGTYDSQVPVLDLKNLNYTHDGKSGYSNDSSEDLGQITGIHFLFNFDYLIGTLRVFAGDLTFRVTMYDTEDNVWYQDFKYRFLGDTQQVILPISGFRIYRARNPFAATLGDIITNILTPELKILEIFETRKIRRITIQWQESYDSAGRYSPASLERFFLTFGTALRGDIRFVGKVDAFAFVKAPIATAKDGNTSTKYNLMEDIKQYSKVSNVEQLQKIANAELQLSTFRKDNFVIRTTGKCDVKAGDSLFLHDQDITNESDIVILNWATSTDYKVGDRVKVSFHSVNKYYECIVAHTSSSTNKPPGDNWKDITDSTGNAKKLAIKKVNYTINAKDGPSGFWRYITVMDRINL